MFGSLASCESQNCEKHKANMPEGSETSLSRKREASPVLALPPSTLAEALGSASGQKRRQTSHDGLACWQSAQTPSKGNAVLCDINEPSSPPHHSLLQVSYGPPTCSSAQPAQDAAAASTAFGFMRQSTQNKGHLSEHWSNGVSADADCFAFQQDDMDFMSADDNWLEPSNTNPQKDCPQPTPVLSANAGTAPWLSPPSPSTARPLNALQHAVTAAEGQLTFARRQSGCLALKHSSQTEALSPVGKHDAATKQHQQQQQQAGRTAAVGPRLSLGGGLHANPNGQGPLGQGRASAFYSTGSAPFSRGWTRIQAPSPSPSPTPASNQGSGSTVYRFQGSSSTGGVQECSPSQVGGPHPPMGITPPGSNLAMAPAMQPYAARASPGTAPTQSHQQQQQQEQEQHIVTKMQQCMVFTQKMQQLLQTGRNLDDQPLTDEVRERYQTQGSAVVAQYNRLLAQYNMLRQGVVGRVGSGQPTETLTNHQQRLAAEATQVAAPLQGCTQGAVEGATLPAQRGPNCPPDPTGQPVPVGRNAGRRFRGSASVADADADADDYDRDLQAALVASVANQPGEWVNATHLTDVEPEEKPGEKGPAATCPSRAVPCNALAAEEAAQVDEISRLTAEPLMLRAQNGVGVVWQNEKDTSVPKGDPPTQATPPTPQQYAHGDAVFPDTAAKAETKSASAAAAALPVPTSAEADSTPGGSHANSDSCAEKVAELSLEDNPAGLQLAKEVKEEEEDLSLLKALSKKELQAYGPQSESGYTSGDLCEDVDELDIGSEASEGAVSDTCSEEQEDFQAVRLAADEEAASKAAGDAQLQDDWVLTEADGPEWI